MNRLPFGAFAVLCTFVPLASAQEDGQPRRATPGAWGGNSWFEASDIDLGSFLEGEKAHGAFKFKNPRDEVHKLSNIQPNCACAKTTIKIGDRRYVLRNQPVANSIFRVWKDENKVEQAERVQHITVGAGEAGVVEVEIDLRGVKGKKEATIAVTTSDKQLPMVNLKARTMAASFFEVMPPEINLNKMSWSDKRDFSFQITSPIQPDFEITGHDDLPEKMAVAYRKEMREGKATWVVNGSYGPGLEARTSGGIINLQTNVQGKKVPVRVIAWIDGPLEVKPGGFLGLGMVRQQQGISKKVEFTAAGDFALKVEKFELKNLTIPEEFVKVTTSEAGNSATVELEIAPGAPRKLVRGEIIVHLNHPAAKQKEIQFNGFVR